MVIMNDDTTGFAMENTILHNSKKGGVWFSVKLLLSIPSGCCCLVWVGDAHKVFAPNSKF